jgi:uncharacterized iron-regulated membrane protein
MASRVRSIVLVTHRWLGISSSVVLSIVGLTGAVLASSGTSLLRRVSGRLHETLAMGRIGWWLVVGATVMAVLLQLGGLYLWWKRKTIAVRVRSGWRLGMFDLHHAAGLLALPLMFLLAATGVGMAVVTPANPELRRIIVDLHTTRGFSTPVKLVYMIATTGFLVQSMTGLVMWWKPRPGRLDWQHRDEGAVGK